VGPYLSDNNNNNINNYNNKPLAKLLVVDDESDIIEFLKPNLEKNGFKVNAFTDPVNALENFRSNSKEYCLMLADIRMPALSGIKLARQIKEINPLVKVLLMTTFEINDNEFSKLFPSSQVDGFVRKPVQFNDIINIILGQIGQTKRIGRSGE
jgi:DNA-binding NtrC family response regulator